MESYKEININQMEFNMGYSQTNWIIASIDCWENRAKQTDFNIIE